MLIILASSNPVCYPMWCGDVGGTCWGWQDESIQGWRVGGNTTTHARYTLPAVNLQWVRFQA